MLLFIRKFCIILGVVLLFICYCNSLRIRGSWKPSEFYKFLIKFGFQQTDLSDINTVGYVYGNITSSGNGTAKLVVTYSDRFYDLYENRRRKPFQKSCTSMFSRIGKIAYDGECLFSTTEDFIRTVPCQKNDVCLEEQVGGSPTVIQNSQFTFRIKNEFQPRFYFISLVACRHVRNVSRIVVPGPEYCYWQSSTDNNIEINYDIWLVNGNPQVKHANPFEHQFSFELHNIFELYFVFFILYLFIVPIQVYSMRKQPGPLPLLLVVSMSMTFVGIFCNLMHVLTFAFNGEGFPSLAIFGDFVDVVAQCVFMMTLLLIVKGYTITRDRMSLRARTVLSVAWATYTAGSIALYFWNLSAMDPLAEPDEWQTQPGLMILIFRLLIMAWFLLELRSSMGRETNSQMAEFYLHFGAGFLVWFVYLPILAVISSHVSILWRHKTVVSVKSCADFVSFCVLIHLLWPTRHNLIFSFQRENQTGLDELEFEALLDDAILTPQLRAHENRRPKKPKNRPTTKYQNVPKVSRESSIQSRDSSDADDDSDYDNRVLEPNSKHSSATVNKVVDIPINVKATKIKSSEESGC